MLYKTIALELRRQRPTIHDQLRRSRTRTRRSMNKQASALIPLFDRLPVIYDQLRRVGYRQKASSRQRPLWRRLGQTSRCQRQHHPRPAVEEHVDADEHADHPRARVGPLVEDCHAQRQGDDAGEQRPAPLGLTDRDRGDDACPSGESRS
jgi:hypothetical protein